MARLFYCYCDDGMPRNINNILCVCVCWLETMHVTLILKNGCRPDVRSFDTNDAFRSLPKASINSVCKRSLAGTRTGFAGTKPKMCAWNLPTFLVKQGSICYVVAVSCAPRLLHAKQQSRTGSAFDSPSRYLC